MESPHFITLRIGKSNPEEAKWIEEKSSGVQTSSETRSIRCKQAAVEAKPGSLALIWLGSDNEKGAQTAWKQGFKAIARIVDSKIASSSEESEITIQLGYVFKEAVNRIDSLKYAPYGYYYCSALPIIGVDDRANQTARYVNPKAERCSIEALFFIFRQIYPDFSSDIVKVFPEVSGLLGFCPADPKYIDGEVETTSACLPENNSQFERNRIIFGAPGTGKSFLLEEQARLLLGAKLNNLERVTFYSDYLYSDFVGTYKPVSDDNGEAHYAFIPGPFLRVLLNASRDTSGTPHLLIVEEINRANAASVFGDMFQLLDRDSSGRSSYSLHPSEDMIKFIRKELNIKSNEPYTLRIPSNMYIWCTMNSADQGVFPIDTAFKRRWSFEYLDVDCGSDAFSAEIIFPGEQSPVSWDSVRRGINNKLLQAGARISEDKLLGAFFLSPREIMGDNKFFLSVFKSKVLMYLYEDAAKQVRRSFFEESCANTYSQLCKNFDRIGLRVFGESFIADYCS